MGSRHSPASALPPTLHLPANALTPAAVGDSLAPSQGRRGTISRDGSRGTLGPEVKEYMAPDLRSWMLHRALIATGRTGVEAVEDGLGHGLSRLPDLEPRSAPASPELRGYRSHQPSHLTPPPQPPSARLHAQPPTYRTDAVPHHDPVSCGPPIYDCVAVIQHIGASLSSGHYIAHVRHRASGSWFTIDDASVREIPAAEVAKKEAYVLFYSRRVPQPMSAPDITAGPGIGGGVALGPSPTAAEGSPTSSSPATPTPRAGHRKGSAASNSGPPPEPYFPGPLPLPATTSSEPVFAFVSRQWWSRYCSVPVPGPLSCGDVLCDHGSVKRQLAERIKE